MKNDYQEIITAVSTQVAKTFLSHEDNLAARATLLDADIAEITRQIGVETTKIVLEHVRDDLVEQKQREGFVVQKRPIIRFNSIFGPIALRSPYLWKPYEGAKPLKNAMNITHHGRSEAVIRALADFGSEESFGHAATRFREHYHYALHSSTVSRVTKQVADDALAYVEQTLSRADEHALTVSAGVDQMLVELDGCEIRTAVFAPVENSEETTPVYKNPKKQKILNWRDVRIGLARPLDSLSKTYVGKKDSYPEVVSDLFQAAVLEGMSPRTQVIGVGDGGIGLKEALETQFPTMRFILDKPHLKDHLYETAEALGISQPDRAAWVKPRLDAISQGNVEQVKKELDEEYAKTPHERLRRLLGYLTRFYEAVDYTHFTRQGFPIGSGEVESAHKTIPQKRLKLPGACWHPDSINPMVALRIVRANDWWDDFWKGKIEEKLAA